MKRLGVLTVILSMSGALSLAQGQRQNFQQAEGAKEVTVTEIPGVVAAGASRLYVSTGAAGIQVFSPEGKYLGAIPTHRDVASIAFSGPDKKTLYAQGRGALGPDGKEFRTPEGVRNNAKTIYKIPMLVQGFKGRAK